MNNTSPKKDYTDEEWEKELKEMMKKDPTILSSSVPGNIKRSRFSRIKQNQ